MGAEEVLLQGALQFPCLSPPCPPALSPGACCHFLILSLGPHCYDHLQTLSCKPVSTSLPISLWQLTSVNLLSCIGRRVTQLPYLVSSNTVFSFIAYTCPPSISGVRLQAQEGVMSGAATACREVQPMQNETHSSLPRWFRCPGAPAFIQSSCPSLNYILTDPYLCCPSPLLPLLKWGGMLLFSHSVMSSSLWPHGWQHTRLPCPSPSPRACSDSCSLSQWCHPTISSSVALFSCLQSFPASGSFLNSRFFTSGG